MAINLILIYVEKNHFLFFKIGLQPLIANIKNVRYKISEYLIGNSTSDLNLIPSYTNSI